MSANGRLPPGRMTGILKTLGNLALGTALQVLRVNAAGTGLEFAAAPARTLRAAVATTSGTQKDETSIPAGTTEIDIMLSRVSIVGADTGLLLQLGDSGGIETSGYLTNANAMSDTSGAVMTSYTNGFTLRTGTQPAAEMTGIVQLRLMDATTFTWSMSSVLSSVTGTPIQCYIAGEKSLSAELDRIRLSTTGGSAFDNGKYSIAYR